VTLESKKEPLNEAALKLQADLDLGWTVVVALESDGSTEALAQIMTGDPDDVAGALTLAAALNSVIDLLRAYAGKL